MISDKFNKQGNLLIRLVLGNSKMGRSLHPPARVLKIYIDALPEFCYTYCSNSLNIHCFLKALLLKMGRLVGTVDRIYSPRTGDSGRRLGPA